MSIIPTATFEWDSDDCVLVHDQAAVAVYRNARGGIVIRQRGWDEDSDVFVIIRPEYAALVAAAIMREASDATAVAHG